MPKEKLQHYRSLVQDRQRCERCADLGLKNPSSIEKGVFDSDEIGPWTRWNGDLNASVMVVGQEWGGIPTFCRQKGLDRHAGTNRTLQKLLESIGISVEGAPINKPDSGLFLTNAVLCLKDGPDSAPVKPAWFRQCGAGFLKAQIELVSPHVVVALGQRAYMAIRDVFDCPRVSFRRAVEAHKAIPLGFAQSLVPVYHCSQTVLNTHRSFEMQLDDWDLVRRELSRVGQTHV
jgi:uracil-DNA glycosylase